MSQTKLGSFAEAWANIAIGFSINYVANLLIFPHYGMHISLADNFSLGCIYTVISWGRSFVLRRWFNGLKFGNKAAPARPAAIADPLPSVIQVGMPAAVGDVKSDARGSGARYNSGKPDFSMIPLFLLEGEARVWSIGAKKYAAWNWAKGMAWSVPMACIMRHLAKFQRGEDLDQETGESHLDHIACNLRMLQLYAKTFPEGDDRPTKWLK